MIDIDKILLKVLNDEAGKKEYSALEAWKKESANNIQLLNDLKASQTKTAPYKAYDKEKAWDKLNAIIEPQSPLVTPIVPKPKNVSKRPWIGLAFMGLLILGITAYFLYPTEPLAPKSYKTENSNQQFALADDTQIWLKRGGSSLAVVSDFEESRNVELQGEAYFDVASDKAKPFYIMLGNNDKIKVVGTSFNILSLGQALDLIVYEGIVELHTLDRVLELRQGDRATRINGAIVKAKNTDKNKDSWKTNNLVFDNSDLGSVFKKIEEHYDVKIVHNHNSELSCLVRTRFTNETISEVISELATLNNFEFEIKESIIHITNLTCN